MRQLKKSFNLFITFFLFLSAAEMTAQNADPFKPDFSSPKQIAGMKLVWNDEFNKDGNPDSSSWRYEKGFVRNKELQWYQSDNAYCKAGTLVIEGRKERVKNPRFKENSVDWKQSREFAEYTSASIQTRGKHQWLFGRFEIRARIDTAKGAWPAIWTLGNGGWPECGEIDIMEFYRRETPIILANVAWGTAEKWKAMWNERNIPLTEFTSKDPEWVKKFHVWRMDWNSESIKLYIDDNLVNVQMLSSSINFDGTNPFLKPQFLLLNLAIGSNGDDPSASQFPIKYEIDYVRVYQVE